MKRLWRNGEGPYVKCIHPSQKEVETSLQVPSTDLSVPLCYQHHLPTQARLQRHRLQPSVMPTRAKDTVKQQIALFSGDEQQAL